MHWCLKKIECANNLCHLSFVLASELRQSSDDLTRMARSYMVTGNPIFKSNYLAILDITKWKKAPSGRVSKDILGFGDA